MARAATVDITVTPSSAPLGADVSGVDLRQIDDALFARIHRAWIDHQVLLFRGQTLSDADLTAFSRRFGALDHAPIQENGRRFVDGYPEIYVVSNVLGADGQPIGSLGAGEAVWHTDMSYLPEPPKASMLYALEVPSSGGNTEFVDMYKPVEALPHNLRAAIAGREVKHDGTYNSGGYVRAGVTATDDPIKAPGQLHPIICTHPESGRLCLYLGRRRNAYITGLPLDESERLLNEIWSIVDRAEYVWTHRWKVGDLVLWDNRCTMHRRDPFDASQRRVMHRTQIKGETRPAA